MAIAEDPSHVENRLAGKPPKFGENGCMDGGFPSKPTLNIADCSFGDADSMAIAVGANASEDRGVATGRRNGHAVLPSLDRPEKTMANVGRVFNR
ncbi:MAG: hypothetical protein CMM63_00390 [Rhodospirillaceae bacterium]|nr:hypothetical protein [Rhodospirillaceae bacterium]